MDPLVAIGLVIAGFSVGALAFARVGRWLVGIHALIKSDATSSRTALALAVLLAPGPWILVAVGILASQLGTRPWVSWLLGGMGAAVLFFGAISIYLARKAAGTKKSAA